MRLLLAINRNDCTFLRLLLAINRDDVETFFLLTPYSKTFEVKITCNKDAQISLKYFAFLLWLSNCFYIDIPFQNCFWRVLLRAFALWIQYLVTLRIFTAPKLQKKKHEVHFQDMSAHKCAPKNFIKQKLYKCYLYHQIQKEDVYRSLKDFLSHAIFVLESLIFDRIAAVGLKSIFGDKCKKIGVTHHLDSPVAKLDFSCWKLVSNFV